MDIDFSELSAAEIYHTMVQTLVPRPVAWVLSQNNNQSLNLAPFSYFNAVSSDPPLIMISVGKKSDGSFKDTRVNIEERQDFVIHIPSGSQAQEVTASSATFPREQSEVENLQLPTTEFSGSPLPRIEGCPVAYYCQLFDIMEIGATPMSMILGQIQSAYIDDHILRDVNTQVPTVDTKKMDPLARLGGIQYALLGDILSINRPK